MAIGDGIRRDVATVSEEERERLRDAFLLLDTTKYAYPDGVTYWDRQEEVHKGAHAAGQDVHGGPAFLPWHRELSNRLEHLLRLVDPQLSLHYWDWTTDPRVAGSGRAALFTTEFMGSSNGDIGAPFPDFESTEGPLRPKVWRHVAPGKPKAVDRLIAAMSLGVAPDDTIVTAGDDQPTDQQYTAMDQVLQGSHNYIHSGYIGGTIFNAHFSFHDPFVFLLHSNCDRLWARWQNAPGHAWRLDPTQVYGFVGAVPTSSVNATLEPWATGGPAKVRPWFDGSDPADPPAAKTAKHPTIVAPPLYDR